MLLFIIRHGLSSSQHTRAMMSCTLHLPLIWKVCGPRSIASHLTDRLRQSRGAELTLLGILFALPFDDHIHQSLRAQPNLMLKQTMEACICINTGVKLHLAGADLVMLHATQTAGLAICPAICCTSALTLG